MKVAIILNGISLVKRTFYKKILPPLEDSFQVTVFETRSKNDAVSLAAKATEKRYDLVLSAGGDGTLHQIVNGVLQGNETAKHLPVIGILPLGSGNDFARSVNVSNNLDQLIAAIKQFKTVSINVGSVVYSEEANNADKTAQRYFINVVDVGMGTEVVKKVLKSGRPMGSAVTYYQAILTTFFTYKPAVLVAKTKNWTWKSKMRTFAVANGKYYGHGLCIAPEAHLDDDMFDIFACGNVSVLDFIIQSLPLKQGKKVRHKAVKYQRTEAVELSADRPIEIEADGEILGWLPASVSISPLQLKILVE